jgi:hypothetical protein
MHPMRFVHLELTSSTDHVIQSSVFESRVSIQYGNSIPGCSIAQLDPCKITGAIM